MNDTIENVKHRVRLLQLLSAAEKAAMAPIALDKVHAFAYLADILSPVWHLRPFQDRIGRTGRPPYFPDLQRELDILVGMGLVEPSDLHYLTTDSDGPQFSADFAIRLDSADAQNLLNAFQMDDDLAQEQKYLDALADALASIPDEEITRAASHDLMYADDGMHAGDYVDLDAISSSSRTARAVASFDKAFPNSRLTPARRLYMYANYLGRRANG